MVSNCDAAGLEGGEESPCRDWMIRGCTAPSNDLPSRAAALTVGRELVSDEDCV